METATLLIILGVVVVIIALVIIALAKNYRKVSPNQVLIVTGGKGRTVIGGGTFIKPFIEAAEILPLDVYTIKIKTPEVLTKLGVHIIAEASAQIKISSQPDMIQRAAEQFLGRGANGIKEVGEHIIEGYVRTVIGSMTVEEIYQNRDEFSRKVRQGAEQDLSRMGLEVLSFNLGDISDNQGYINALGLPKIAAIKRDATIAQAEAEKDTIIKSAQARKEGDIVRYQVETEIASASRDYELQRSDFQMAINKKKAEADSTYEVEKFRQAATLKQAEYDVRLIEKKAAIAVEKQEIERRELELTATISKPAQARLQQVQIEADAEKYRIAAEAAGRAEAHKTEGLAAVEVKKAEGISRIAYTRELGKAEAEAMAAKADAYKQYNEAAVSQMVIDKLPELARAVSEPLSKVEKIVLVGNNSEAGASQITGQVTNVLTQLPTVVESLTGIDLLKYFGDKLRKDKKHKDRDKDD